MRFGEMHDNTLRFAMRLATLLATAALILPSAPALAAESAVGGGAILQSLAGLLVVVALIVGLAWLARTRGGFVQGPAVMKPIASLSIGPRERVVIVELNDTWLVLGVAPGRVNTLATLPRPATPVTTDAAQTPASLFADILSRAGIKRHGR